MWCCDLPCSAKGRRGAAMSIECLILSGHPAVCVECLIGKQKKPILFKVTEPSSIPYRTHSACAKRAAYPDPPPVIPVTVLFLTPGLRLPAQPSPLPMLFVFWQVGKPACGLYTWRQQRGYQQGCCCYDGGSNGSLSVSLLRQIPSATLVCDVFVFALMFSCRRYSFAPHEHMPSHLHVCPLRRNCASCKKALWTVVDQLQRCEPLKALSQMGVMTQWTHDQCAYIEVAPTCTRLFLCA